MKVYRLCRTKYADDLSGEGARLFGGRWNNPGVPCIYTSSTRALAVLEYTGNIAIDAIPRALSIVTIEIPDNQIKSIQLKDLPGNWLLSPVPASTKDFGSQLLQMADAPVIQIPSVVIPEEFNFILNPVYSGKHNFRIAEVRDFVYDIRIKSNEVR